MKKKLLSVLLVLCMAASMLLTGCGGQSADEYLGEQITALKEKDTDRFESLLENELAESMDVNTYTLTFPDELKEPYLKFLQKAFSSVTFEVASADKKENGNYSVQVVFTPLDVSKTTNDTNLSYIDSMQGTDLAEEVSALIKKDEAVIKDTPEYGEEVTTELEVKKKGESYSVSDKELEKLIATAVVNGMAPYDSVCCVLDARDYLQSYLDASFKGDFTQFMKQTDRTEEEAQAWYEGDGIFAPPDDLVPQYNERCTAAFKNIYKSCKYSVGVPRRKGGAPVSQMYNYTVDVTFSPNNSIIKASEEFFSRSFYSMEEASAAYVEIFEKYAASPAYGDETTMTIDLSLSSILATQEESGDLYDLCNAICPVPE